MNYTGPLLGTVIVEALVDWTFSGYKRFKVPVAQNWTMMASSSSWRHNL